MHGRDTGPRADIVALNAGAALYVAGKAESIGDGIALSRELIATGKAIAKLDQLRECTARLAGSGK
ncbi:MAG: Anthranilate phosphoribosyltransferase [candidate division BRC1 bacterium ADurb.BinA364]|nr:MAG: Anthranilate phosphoribosyltransferase [candidate division BRC1 bacterium ADurb.BinA364]